jgi:hypothetical protein
VAGILLIDSGLFASSAQFGGLRGTGPLALWGADRCFAFYYKWFAGGLHKSAKLCNLGSGLIDYSQKMTMAAMQIADMNV